MNKNYGKLSPSDRVDTTGGFTDIEDYDKIWRKMEPHAKGNRFQKRSWKDFEEALKKAWKCNFFPDPSKLNLQICLDDDKALFAHGLLRDIPVDEESDLDRVRHVKENQTGFNCHCACLAATGMPICVGFQKVGYGVFDTVVEICTSLFNRKTPDLTGIATLNADRDYF